MRSLLVNDILGWVGAVLIVIAYVFAAIGILPADAPISLVLNIVGSVGVIYASWPRAAYQSVALNAVWALVALVVLTRPLW